MATKQLLAHHVWLYTNLLITRDIVWMKEKGSNNFPGFLYKKFSKIAAKIRVDP